MVSCRRCGRDLTDPESAKKGIGPICESKGYIESAQGSIFDAADLPFDQTTRDIVCRRNPDGSTSFNFPHKIKHHSPTGMEWGYSGLGPADFALNCLLMFVPEGIAREHYQQFKFKFVAGLAQEGGTIPGRDIQSFLKESIRGDHE